MHEVIIELLRSESKVFGNLLGAKQSGKDRPQPGGFAINNIVQASFEGNAFDAEKLNRMYRYPASFKEAKLHKLASKFGYSHHTLQNDDKVAVCPDCESLTSTMEIPLCYSTTPAQPEEGKDVFLVATDASLYFIFVKMVIFYLIMKMIVVDAWTLYSSLHGQMCANMLKLKPPQTCAYTMSGYNLAAAANQSAINIIDYTALAFVLLSILFFYFFRKKLNQIRDWLDFNVVSQDDFAILVEGIPKIIYDEDTTQEDVTFDLKR